MYGFGIRVSYNFKKFSIVSGIEQQQFGEKTRTNTTFGDQIDPTIGFTGSVTQPLLIKYRYNFIVIPLLLEANSNLKIRGKIVKFSVLGGVKTNIYYKATTSLYYDNSSSKSNYHFDQKNICLSSSYRILFHKKINDQFKLKLGPTFDIFHQSISNSNLIKRLPYRTSLLIGITF